MSKPWKTVAVKHCGTRKRLIFDEMFGVHPYFNSPFFEGKKKQFSLALLYALQGFRGFPLQHPTSYLLCIDIQMDSTHNLLPECRLDRFLGHSDMISAKVVIKNGNGISR